MAEIHDHWSPLAFIKLLLDLSIRCEEDGVEACAYRYWLRVEESRVLMSKFLNDVILFKDQNHLNTLKCLIAKVDDESFKLASRLKVTAINDSTDDPQRNTVLIKNIRVELR